MSILLLYLIWLRTCGPLFFFVSIVTFCSIISYYQVRRLLVVFYSNFFCPFPTFIAHFLSPTFYRPLFTAYFWSPTFHIATTRVAHWCIDLFVPFVRQKSFQGLSCLSVSWFDSSLGHEEEDARSGTHYVGLEYACKLPYKQITLYFIIPGGRRQWSWEKSQFELCISYIHPGIWLGEVKQNIFNK
jgi:hypothetical protein